MAEFIIQGGRPIQGRHRVPGNKNAALPMLAACTLTDEPVTIANLPLINDVQSMLDILADLGASVELHGHTATICCAGVRKRTIDPALCRRVRTSILFAGPMVARHGKVILHPPGGDVIGRRRLDTHFDGLRDLGVEIDVSEAYRFSCGALVGADILLDEASVTATENLVMAAVLAEGRTTLFNAACEPHVQQLCRMLNEMGASIDGVGTNRLEIGGVSELRGGRFRVPSDAIEAASYIAAAALTGGELFIDNAPADDLRIVMRTFQRLGIDWHLDDANTLHLPANQTLEIRNDYGAAIPKIEDGPWPNFPSDLLSVSVVLATQAAGTVLFFEKMFESRLYFVDRLIEMGARIVQCDPHRVIVTGPARLHGSRVVSPDIRAGMSMLLAALCADGTSTVGNAEIIDRGYEGVAKELRRLGADVQRVA